MTNETFTRKILSELDIMLPTLEQYQKIEKLVEKQHDNNTLIMVGLMIVFAIVVVGCAYHLRCN